MNKSNKKNFFKELNSKTNKELLSVLKPNSTFISILDRTNSSKTLKEAFDTADKLFKQLHNS